MPQDSDPVQAPEFGLKMPVLHILRSCTIPLRLPSGAWFGLPEKAGFLRQVARRTVYAIAESQGIHEGLEVEAFKSYIADSS